MRDSHGTKSKIVAGLEDGVGSARGALSQNKTYRVEAPSPERDIETVRHHWDQGKASGRSGPLDIERFVAEARGALSVSRRGQG